MIQTASKLLKLLYCMTLVAMVVPAGLLGATGAVGMAVGGPSIGGLIFSVWAIYRIYQVVRFQDALDVFVSNKGGKILRGLGIFLMIVGLSTSLLIPFIKPLTLAIFGQSGDAGVAFFVVGIALYFISSTGWLGILLFEISRLIGNRNKPQINQHG